MRRAPALLSACLLGILLASVAVASTRGLDGSRAFARPNIILVLTDDQDTASLEHMPAVQRELVGKGTTFENATFSDPLCCPSRASMLTGQYPHNHGVTSNNPNDKVFAKGGLASRTYGAWLDNAGYRTAYVGKFLNGYRAEKVMHGWDEWFVPTENAASGGVNDNGRIIETSARDQDTVFVREAMRFLNDAAPKPTPFLMTVSFHAAHRPGYFEKKYVDDFRDAELPRSPNFDEEDRSDKPKWLKNLPGLSQGTIAKMGAYHKDRLRSLQTVDAAVARMISALERAGDLDNTYILFYTDNGFHLGSHADKGKSTPYEEDVNFPLIVRGPGVPAGASSEALVMNNDVAPTFADLADARAPNTVDGRSIVPLFEGTEPPNWRTRALVEGWDKDRPGSIPDYKALRTKGTMYVEYETGEKELYDLLEDPYQLQNAYGGAAPATRKTLAARLDALRSCQGGACRRAENAD